MSLPQSVSRRRLGSYLEVFKDVIKKLLQELSQTRQRQLEAKISELEDTVKSLSVTAPAPSIAEPTQGATTADATPAVTQPEALQTVEAAAAAEPQEIAAPASQVSKFSNLVAKKSYLILIYLI